MKEIAIVVVVLFSICNTVLGQQHYYWANGKKYPLELYAEKQYVLVRGGNKASIVQGLGVQEQDLSDLKQMTVSKMVNSRSIRYTTVDDLFWGFVDRPIDKDRLNRPEILYVAPFFRANGKELGLSQFFYVKLKNEQDVKILERLARQNNVEVVGNDNFMPLWYVLACDKNSKGNALEMANLFHETGNFLSAQPDLMVDYGVNCRNDTFFNQQWHLSNTGQFGGTAGSDTRACQAWDITTGCENIIVAVLDHGLEFNHPDFDNISPISFDTDTGTSPSIVRGDHGVAVAGIIGASANNEIGVAGLAPNVQLMSISNSLVLVPLSSQRLSNGINFAWMNGADVINNSWGSDAIQQQGLINDAIDNAVTLGRGGLGTIVVFAAGNDNMNSIIFPSSNPQVISVGALSMCNERKSPTSCDTEDWGSNYGTGLDVTAPGVLISTTDRQGNLGYNPNLPIHLITNGTLVAEDYADRNYTTWFNGTSSATPQVSSIAALILSVNPLLTVQQVRNIIESTTDKVGNYTYTMNTGEQTGLTWNNQMGYGRVNAFKAVQAALPNITGPAIVCSTSPQFMLNNVPPGAQVTWQVSHGRFLSPNSGNGTTTSFSVTNPPLGSSGTVTFTITPACGNPYQVQKTFWMGPPTITYSPPGQNPCSSSPYYYTTPIAGASYHWSVDNPNVWIVSMNGFSSVSVISINPEMFTLTLTISAGNCTYTADYINQLSPGYYCDCFYDPWQCPGQGGGFGLFATYPNPASDHLDIVIDETEFKSEEFQSYEVVLLDNFGTEKFRMTTKDRARRIDTSMLRPGQYFLNFIYKGKTIQRQIIIDR